MATITTKLKPGFVEVFEEDDKIPSYEVSWQEYKEIINSLADNKGSGSIVEKTAVKVCPGLVSMSPEFFTAKSGQRTITVDIPEIRADIKFKYNKNILVYPHCIFPEARIVLDFTRTSNSTTDHDLQLLAMRVHMYHNGIMSHYPFPNVHSNGTVCWGSVSLPQYVSRRSIEGAPLYMAAFREANFNTDLTPSLGRFSTLQEYFQYLSTATAFPYDNFS